MISARQKQLIEILQRGLPLVARPYDDIARALGITLNELFTEIDTLIKQSVFKRFATVVRHRHIGFTANAMVVWDVPDEDVDRIGSLLARETSVRLCYRRPRRLPLWPYNLFTMIHGRSREEVVATLARIREHHQLDVPYEILFSKRCFRQRGARYRMKAS